MLDDLKGVAVDSKSGLVEELLVDCWLLMTIFEVVEIEKSIVDSFSTLVVINLPVALMPSVVKSELVVKGCI